MSELREAAELAVTMLKVGPPEYDAGDALEVLEAALAETQDHFPDVTKMVQEPVAWIQPDHLQKARVAPFLCRVEPTQRMSDFIPLYLAPPQRLPLTMEEIEKAYKQIWRNLPDDFEHTSFAWIEQGIRYAEAAHGIKEKT